MIKNVVIVLLLLLLIWFGSALVRVENERYALMTGMCQRSNGLVDLACLAKAETRTSNASHIFYALMDTNIFPGRYLWTNEEWQGYVYPNKTNLLKDIHVGVFRTLEECREAAASKLSEVSSISAGDYECGLNCKQSLGLDGPKVCEKTER